MYKSNLEVFLKKANKKHNNFYDYSLVIYVNSSKKIKIICPEHGEFEQEANSHLQGKKCMKCSIIERAKKRKDSIGGFIEKCIEIHGEKYDYSLVEYKNNKTNVEIICKINDHGIFKQRPDCHIYLKQGCPKCGGTSKLYLDDFIKRGNDRHEGFYNYSGVTFNNVNDFINISCPKHGIFKQNVKAHLDGNGCPKCKTSKLEKRILKLLKFELKLIEIKQFYKNKWLGRQHIDIYLPEYKIAIECHGIQHYEPVEKFGGYKSFKRRIELDNKKRFLCYNNNVKLFEIPFFYSKNEVIDIIDEIKKIIKKTKNNKDDKN